MTIFDTSYFNIVLLKLVCILSIYFIFGMQVTTVQFVLSIVIESVHCVSVLRPPQLVLKVTDLGRYSTHSAAINIWNKIEHL